MFNSRITYFVLKKLTSLYTNSKNTGTHQTLLILIRVLKIAVHICTALSHTKKKNDVFQFALDIRKKKNFVKKTTGVQTSNQMKTYK